MTEANKLVEEMRPVLAELLAAAVSIEARLGADKALGKDPNVGDILPRLSAAINAAVDKLAKKLNVPVIFTEEWEQRNKLRAEGSKLWAEGSKLWAEGSKLWAEGDKLCAKGDKLYAESDKLRAEGYELYTEGGKLRVEGDKLYAKGDKLRAEGDKLYLDRVIKEVGPDAEIDWETGRVS